MLAPKLAACMINFICFDLDPEIECKLFTDKLEMEGKFQNGVILSKFDGKSSKVNQVITFSAPTSISNMKALA